MSNAENCGESDKSLRSYVTYGLHTAWIRDVEYALCGDEETCDVQPSRVVYLACHEHETTKLGNCQSYGGLKCVREYRAWIESAKRPR